MREKATFTRGRRLVIGLNVLFVSLLAPLAAGLIAYLAFRPELRRRFDWTARRTFTLSERTLRVLEGLKDPVDVFTCFRPVDMNEAGQYAPGMEAVIGTIAMHANDLLREFEVRSRGKVRAHAFDPNQTGHLARIDDLSKRIGERAVNLAVVEAGQRRRVVRMKDLAEYDAGTRTSEAFTRPTLHGFRDEEALAKAILSVTEEREIKIGFLRGHGERDPDFAGLDPTGRWGLGIWATALVAQNYRLRGVDLSQASALTKDEVDVLVIADPVKPLSDAEVEVIVRYAKEGGKLALLLGPGAANSLDFPLLEQVYGVSRIPHPVCQQTALNTAVGSVVSTEANLFFTDSWGEHPIVRPLKSAKMRMYWADVSALTPLAKPGEGTREFAELAWTTSEAWVDLPGGDDRKYNHKFDPGAEEKPRPWSLAAAIARGGAGSGRAVVVGSASALDDKGMNSAPANRDFGLNLVDWLTEREQLISIAPKPFDVMQVDLTGKEFGTIFLYVVVGVPALALLLGVAVFWLRRN
jgi:hypothetical protein